REREPGSRRDRYVLHNELWYETFTRRDQVLTPAEPPAGPPAGPRSTDRLRTNPGGYPIRV
ncbi:hypothetical protein ACWDEV_29985, partial [Streptomyces virginiae]